MKENDETKLQDELMDAITAPDSTAVRVTLYKVRRMGVDQKLVLLTVNAQPRYNNWTPLMAAATSGDMTIVGKNVLTQLRTVLNQVVPGWCFCGVGMWHGGGV